MLLAPVTSFPLVLDSPASLPSLKFDKVTGAVTSFTMGIVNRHKETQVDPILTRMVEEDKVAWYKKPNLRHLYFMLFPTCMGVELTSGFDSQLINALQIVPPGLTVRSLEILRKPEIGNFVMRKSFRRLCARDTNASRLR